MIIAVDGVDRLLSDLGIPDASPRMTIPSQLVLRAMLEDPTREMDGAEIGAAAGLPSATAILASRCCCSEKSASFIFITSSTPHRSW